MFQRQVLILVLLFCHFGVNLANIVNGSELQKTKMYYAVENPVEPTQMSKLVSTRSGIYSTIEGPDFKRSNFVHNHMGSALSANIGNALGVAGLGLLFISQLGAALHIPFLIPMLLVPLTFLIVASLTAHGDNGGYGGSGGGVIR